MRTYLDYVRDMRNAGKTDSKIQAVARVIRGGVWYEDVKIELAMSDTVKTPLDFAGCGLSCF